MFFKFTGISMPPPFRVQEYEKRNRDREFQQHMIQHWERAERNGTITEKDRSVLEKLRKL